jgi:hypothetical protein
VHGEQPPDVDPFGRVAQHHAHRFARPQRLAEGLALGHIGAGDLHAALGEAEPAHAVGEAGRAKPDLGDLEPVALLQQAVLERDLEPVELEFAYAAMLVRPHVGDAPDDAPVRIVLAVEEGREAAPRVVGGARHEDEVAGDGGAGDEPLAAMNNVTVALAFRLRQHHAAGVGARTGVRLGHHEGRPHFSVDDRLQPGVLHLLAGQHLVEQAHVAVIRGLAVEDDGPEYRPVGFLVERRPADERKA